MATTTSRLKLIKPADGESVDIDNINANSDTIDKHPGIFICTSTSRPANPYTGQTILETDIGELVTFIGGKWKYHSAIPWEGIAPLYGTFDSTQRVKTIGGNIVVSPNASNIFTIPLPVEMKSLLTIAAQPGDNNNGHYFVWINSNPFIASGARFLAFEAGGVQVKRITRVIWSAAISY